MKLSTVSAGSEQTGQATNPILSGMLTALAWLSHEGRTSDATSHTAHTCDRRATQHGRQQRVHVGLLLCDTSADYLGEVGKSLLPCTTFLMQPQPTSAVE